MCFSRKKETHFIVTNMTSAIFYTILKYFINISNLNSGTHTYIHTYKINTNIYLMWFIFIYEKKTYTFYGYCPCLMKNICICSRADVQPTYPLTQIVQYPLFNNREK